MSLEGDAKWVPFSKGLEQGIDSRASQAPVLASAVNVVYDTEGRLSKRKGYEVRSTVTATGSFAAGITEEPLRVWEGAEGEELVTTANLTTTDNRASVLGHMFTMLSGALREDVPCGPDGLVPFLGEARKQVINATLSTTSAPLRHCAATYKSRTIVVYELTTSSIRLCIYDSTTHHLIYAVTRSNAAQPKCWVSAGSDSICVGYLETSGNTIEWIPFPDTTVDVSAPWGGTMLTTGCGAATSYTTDQQWDACAITVGANTYQVFATTGSHLVDVCLMTIGGVGVTNITLASDPKTIAVSELGERLGVYWEGGITATGYIYAAVIAADGSVTSSATGAITAAGASGNGAVGWYKLDSAPTAPYLVVAMTDPSAPRLPNGGYDTAVRFIDATDASVDSTYYIYSAVPCSQVFANGETPLIAVHQGGTTFATYVYALRFGAAKCCGRLQDYTAPAATYDLPKVGMSAGATWAPLCLREVIEGNVSGVAGGVRSIAPVVYHLDVASRRRACTATLGGASLIAAGTALHYDGARVCESGFWDTPLFTAVAATAGTDVNWSYRVTYEEVDAFGRVHRSGVGDPVAVALATSSAVNMVVAYPYRTLRRDSTARICIWRTVHNGSLFYLVASLKCGAMGSTVNYADSASGTSDATLLVREALYTDTGLPEEWTPPPTQALCEHKRRIWCAQGSRLYFTHEHADAFGPRWSSTNYMDTPHEVTALASAGDALLIFGERTTHVILGDGPDALGNGPWAEPVFLAAVGCPRAQAGQRGAARVSLGVCWRGAGGIYMSDGNTVDRISDTAQDVLTSFPICTGIADDTTRNRLHVTLTATEALSAASGGLVWQYDLDSPVWTSCTVGPTGVCCGAMVSGYHTIAGYGAGFRSLTYRQGTAVWQDSVGSSSTAPVSMSLTTHPIFPQGAMLPSRTRRLSVDGQRVGASVSMTICATIDDSTSTDWNRTYALTGSGRLSVQYEIPLQRFEAVSLTISEALTDVGQASTSGFDLAGLIIYSEQDGDPRRGSDRRL
jgi:hypothetical protein